MGTSDALKNVSDEELAVELIARRTGSLLDSAGSPRYPGARGCTIISSSSPVTTSLQYSL
eukprot:COSAG02_NODE_565_length_20246_cov_13.930163_12_plen_60_part_00